MYISRISARLKGRTIAQDLSPCTIIWGPNFSGKTAIFTACRHVLTGLAPECGGRPRDAFDALSDGTQMESAVAFSDGSGLQRVLQMKNGSVQQTVTPESRSDEFRDLPLLSPSEYFEMTDSQRIAYVFERCELPSGYNLDGIVARLHRLSFGEQHSEAAEKEKTALLATIRQNLEDAGTVQDGLEQAVGDKGYLRSSFTEANRSAKDSEGAIRILAELKHREPECSAETVADLEQRIATAQRRLDAAQREAGAAAEQRRAAIDAVDANKRRRELLEKKIKVATEVMEKPAPQIDYPTDEQVSEAERAFRDNVVAVAAGDPQQLMNDVNRLRAAVTLQEGYIRDGKDLVADEQKQLEQLTATECCPHCGSKGKGWKARLEQTLKDALDQHAKALLEHEVKLGSLRIELATAEAAQQQYGDAHAAEMRAQQRGRDLADLLSGLRERQRKARLALDLDRDGRVLATEVLRDAKAELETMPNVVPVPAEVLTNGPGLPQMIYTEVTELRNQRDTALRLQSDLKRAAQAAELHHGHAARRDVIKALAEELKAIQGEMVAKAFGKLLETANYIAGTILPSPLAFHDGTIGRWNGSRFVTHKAMSGVERILAYVAIAAALSDDHKLKIAMLDEMGNATPRVQAEILDALLAAVERGILSQVLVIVPSDDPVSYEGYQSVEVRP